MLQLSNEMAIHVTLIVRVSRRRCCNETAIIVLQIIPQAVCSRYGLAVGASLAGLVKVLMFMCYGIAYPISKVSWRSDVFASIFSIDFVPIEDL